MSINRAASSHTVAVPLGILFATLLSGCQNGSSKPASQPETLKQLAPVVSNLVRESRAAERYVSYDEQHGTYYRAIPGFAWQAALAEARHGSASAASYSYAGFAMQVETDESRPDLEQICSSSVHIALYPPATVTAASGARFDPSSGIGNEALSRSEGACGNDYFQLQGLDDDGDGAYERLRYSFPPGSSSTALLNSPVAGSWRLLRDSSELLASFDLPPLQPDAAAVVVHPLPRLNYDVTTGLLESIDIEWFSPADPAQPVSGSGINRTTIALLDDRIGMEIAEQYAAYGLAGRAVFPEHPWRVKDHEQTLPEDTQLQALQISYELEGVDYRFIWR